MKGFIKYVYFVQKKKLLDVTYCRPLIQQKWVIQEFYFLIQEQSRTHIEDDRFSQVLH